MHGSIGPWVGTVVVASKHETNLTEDFAEGEGDDFYERYGCDRPGRVPKLVDGDRSQWTADR